MEFSEWSDACLAKTENQRKRVSEWIRGRAVLTEATDSNTGPSATSGPWTKTWPLAIVRAQTPPWTWVASINLTSSALSLPSPWTFCLSLSLLFPHPVLAHHNGPLKPGRLLVESQLAPGCILSVPVTRCFSSLAFLGPETTGLVWWRPTAMCQRCRGFGGSHLCPPPLRSGKRQAAPGWLCPPPWPLSRLKKAFPPVFLFLWM